MRSWTWLAAVAHILLGGFFIYGGLHSLAGVLFVLYGIVVGILSLLLLFGSRVGLYGLVISNGLLIAFLVFMATVTVQSSATVGNALRYLLPLLVPVGLLAMLVVAQRQLSRLSSR